MQQPTIANVLRKAMGHLCLTLVFSLTAIAQESTGSIQGTVKDQNGATIPGAKVTATSPALVRSLDTTTDKEGTYRFPKLPVGLYAITVGQTGFKTAKNEGITLVLGSELTLDIALATGSVSESVTISATAEAIDVSTSRTSTNITEKFVEITPRGRSFNTLLQVAPGVVYDRNAGSAFGGSSTAGTTGTNGNNPGGGVGGYSVNGASGSENAFIIDGVEVSNIRNGALSRDNAIPFEFIREVQVKSGGLEAEYGGATGGVVNAITKSGSDSFHGEGAFLFTSAAMNSRPRGFWQRLSTNAAVPEFFRQKEDEYRTLYPGFTLGGPILKERLHFFTGYFPEITRTERSINFVSGGAKTTTNRLLRHYALSRVDYAPTQKIQINTSYVWTPIRNAGLLTGTDPRVAPPTNDLSIGGGYTPSNAYTASFTYTPTSKLILSARYGYKYVNDRGNTYGLPTQTLLLYQRATSGPTYSGPVVPTALAGAAGFQNVSNTFAVLKDVLTRHNVYLDGSYITRIAGQQHTLKGGYALNRMGNSVDDDYPNGRFDIYWGEGFTRGSKVNERGAYGYYIWEDGVRHNSTVTGRNQGFYVQDQWQVTQRITLNLGVRFENEFLPPYTKTAANGAAIPNPIDFSWGDKIAPRLGGAWDVLGNGRWKLSGNFGHFFDTMKYELARTSFGGDYWHQRVYKLDGTDLSKLSKASPSALGSLIIDIDNRTVAVNSQGQLDGIDPDIKPMLSREWSVASEHRFGSNITFSGRYTRKQIVRGIEDIGVLDANESEVYTIGNPGFGQTDAKKFTAPNGQPLTPKAVRNYDGLEFRMDHRLSEGLGNGFAKGLGYSASYTYSRLWGNWSGLANSDADGRSQPNVSRDFDLTFLNFDSKGQNVYGLLATDRPHIFKIFANYPLRWMAGTTDFSLSQLAYSGTPLTSTVTLFVPVYYNGRGDLGRTPAFTQTDMLVAHTFNVSERVKIKVDANVINLFNQGIVTGLTTALNRNGNLPLTTAQFFKGFDAVKLVNPNGTNPALITASNPTGAYPPPNINPIYQLPRNYQGIREMRIGFHLTF